MFQLDYGLVRYIKLIITYNALKIFKLINICCINLILMSYIFFLYTGATIAENCCAWEENATIYSAGTSATHRELGEFVWSEPITTG